MKDIREQGQVIFTAVRNLHCKSSFLVNMLNSFGQNGGFEDILEYIQHDDSNLQDILHLMEFLA